MKTKVPSGWRKLRAGEIVKAGDWTTLTVDGTGYVPAIVSIGFKITSTTQWWAIRRTTSRAKTPNGRKL